MNRRAFLAASTATAAGVLSGPLRAQGLQAPSTGRIHTVRGPIDVEQMGATLVHEHVLVDFAGAATVSRARYDAGEAFRTILPHLEALHGQGCRTLFECTPAYLGRDPALLRRLSEASGLHVVTNTEARGGIEGTGIRPGFVKVGVDAGPLSGIDRKLVEAAALCHLDTGLTLAIHTGDGVAALGILAVLKAAGVSPEAYVWVHSQNEGDRATRSWAAQQGAWVELDGVSPTSLETHVLGVLDLLARGLLDRVLVSQDAGWYHVGEPAGGEYRPHGFLFDAFVRALRARGLGEAGLRTLLVLNPARAFAIRRRGATPVVA
jgi:phosphotriesterase-related protein